MNPCDTPLSPFAEGIKGYMIFLGISCAVCTSCCLTLTVTKTCGGAIAATCKDSAAFNSTIFPLLFHYFLKGVPVLLPAAAAVCVSTRFSCRSRHVVTTVNRSNAAQMKEKDLRQGERGGRPASNARPCRRSPPFVVLTSLPRFNRPHSDSISSNRCVELFY